MPRLTSKCSNSVLLLFLLSGLDILHHLVRPPLAAKKKKRDTVAPPGAGSSVVVAPSSVGRGGGKVRTSPTRSSSQGLEERTGRVPAPMALLALEVPAPDVVAEAAKTQEPLVSRVVVTLPPSPPAPLVPYSSTSFAVLDRALTEMG